MSILKSVVAVVVPGAPYAAAVGWAARESARRGAPLRIVVPDDHHHDLERRRSFATAVATARRAAPGVALSATTPELPTLRAVLAATAEAELVVVGGPADHVDVLVTGAFCPVVVVPDRPTPVPRPRAGLPRHSRDSLPVVVGVGPATEPEVLDFAFAETQRRGAGLIAVRTWNDPLIDLGALLPGRIERWDAATARQRQELADQLSAFRLAYPDVETEQLVVEDRCAELLAALALNARLLVLGRPSRGALMNTALPSPAITLARHVPCPVAVVPPAVVSRPSWLPERRVGLADLRG